jgi:hypothetical protein
MAETQNPRDLARLSALLQRAGAMLALDEGALRATTSVSGWSALQHLFHLLLADELSLKNATSLVRGRGRLLTERGPLDPRARILLERGRLPRGTPAPRIVVPPPKPDRALVRAIHADAGAAASAPELAGELPDGPLGIPHQALGVLGAAEWLRFARMHSAHHLRIARAVLGAPA